LGDSGKLEEALDWISGLQNGSSGIEDIKSCQDRELSLQESREKSEEQAAKAIKCDECQKTFSSVELAQLHATKTGHQDFSESTDVRPEMSAEEKVRRLEQLRALLRERRAKEEAARAAESLRLEIARRKSGVAAQEARRELRDREIAKAANQVRRQKTEDKERLLLIRREMEAERREKQVSNEQKMVASSTLVSTSPAPQPVESCRLQVRHAGGIFRATLKPADPLSVLVATLTEDPNVKLCDSSVLIVPFPNKKIAINECLECTMEDLGLCPSASLNLEN